MDNIPRLEKKYKKTQHLGKCQTIIPKPFHPTIVKIYTSNEKNKVHRIFVQHLKAKRRSKQ